MTLAAKLRKRGWSVERQVPISLESEGPRFDERFRADLIFERQVIVKLKSIEKVHPAHKKLVLTHLRLTGMKLGYLHNFGNVLMKDGITRIVSGE